MTVKEYLINTYKVGIFGHINMQEIRPRAICKDGFSVSIQASDMHYCNPRENIENGEYTEVELGFPSKEDLLIVDYAEDSNDLTGTVYGYVPIELVEKLIKKHGGIIS